MFKVKIGYYPELLTPETMKFLGNTKSQITENKNDENVPHLGINELVPVHCNIVKNNHHQKARVFYTFIPNESLW